MYAKRAVAREQLNVHTHRLRTHVVTHNPRLEVKQILLFIYDGVTVTCIGKMDARCRKQLNVRLSLLIPLRHRDMAVWMCSCTSS
jgi:hypothetical protein